MHVILVPFLQLLDVVLDLYTIVVIVWVVMSWLFAFNVVNPHNNAVRMVMDVLARLVEPALAPIRRLLPSLGGIDISPVILLLAIFFVRNVITRLIGNLL